MIVERYDGVGTIELTHDGYYNVMRAGRRGKKAISEPGMSTRRRVLEDARKWLLNGKTVEKPPKSNVLDYYAHQDDVGNAGPRPSTKQPRKRGSTIKGEHRHLHKLINGRMREGDEIKTSSCTVRELLAVAAHMDLTSEKTGRRRGTIFIARKVGFDLREYIERKFGVMVVEITA